MRLGPKVDEYSYRHVRQVMSAARTYQVAKLRLMSVLQNEHVQLTHSVAPAYKQGFSCPAIL